MLKDERNEFSSPSFKNILPALEMDRFVIQWKRPMVLLECRTWVTQIPFFDFQIFSQSDFDQHFTSSLNYKFSSLHFRTYHILSCQWTSRIGALVTNIGSVHVLILTAPGTTWENMKETVNTAIDTRIKAKLKRLQTMPFIIQRWQAINANPGIPTTMKTKKLIPCFKR